MNIFKNPEITQTNTLCTPCTKDDCMLAQHWATRCRRRPSVGQTVGAEGDYPIRLFHTPIIGGVL